MDTDPFALDCFFVSFLKCLFCFVCYFDFIFGDGVFCLFVLVLVLVVLVLQLVIGQSMLGH